MATFPSANPFGNHLGGDESVRDRAPNRPRNPQPIQLLDYSKSFSLRPAIAAIALGRTGRFLCRWGNWTPIAIFRPLRLTDGPATAP
ncbi:MAG: hypothetical protein MH825_14135 [Cyanobacteria bacterium]|nr:hypothetical protein [Cyanobacteriota bacterium]